MGLCSATHQYLHLRSRYIWWLEIQISLPLDLLPLPLWPCALLLPSARYPFGARQFLPFAVDHFICALCRSL